MQLFLEITLFIFNLKAIEHSLITFGDISPTNTMTEPEQ